MSRQNINRAFEMEVFKTVVATEGFTPAARTLGLTTSAVSKLVSRLEARLGVKLLHRTTRRLQPTPEGLLFHERCLRILDDIDCAEHEAAQRGSPRGRVRINCQVAFGTHYLLPQLPVFLARYPEVQLDVVLSDQVVDLLTERCDVAIRTGPLPDSRLSQRRIGASDLALVASPAYLESSGIPRCPEQLREHRGLALTYARHLDAWPFVDAQGNRQLITPRGPLRLGDGESLRQMALAGLGIARLARYHIAADLAEGRLVALLEGWNPRDREEIRAIFVGPGRHLPARVRVLLDFLAEQLAPELAGAWNLQGDQAGNSPRTSR